MGQFIVYQFTNAINGKRYIGYSKKTLEGRFYEHKKRARFNPKVHFHKGIRKWGAENFVGEVLFIEDSERAAKETEILLILDRRPEYNKTMGGDGTPGHPVTDEVREKIRQNTPVRRGSDHLYFGKTVPHLVESNKRRRGIKNPNQARRGESHHMYGKSHSEATIHKMSKVKQGKLFSEETKAKQSASAKARVQTEEGKANVRAAGRRGAEARWAKHRAAKLAAQSSEDNSSG